MQTSKQWRLEQLRQHCDAPVDDEKPPEEEDDSDEENESVVRTHPYAISSIASANNSLSANGSESSLFNTANAPSVVFDFAVRRPQRRQSNDSNESTRSQHNDSSDSLCSSTTPSKEKHVKNMVKTNNASFQQFSQEPVPKMPKKQGALERWASASSITSPRSLSCSPMTYGAGNRSSSVPRQEQNHRMLSERRMIRSGRNYRKDKSTVDLLQETLMVQQKRASASGETLMSQPSSTFYYSAQNETNKPRSDAGKRSSTSVGCRLYFSDDEMEPRSRRIAIARPKRQTNMSSSSKMASLSSHIAVIGDDSTLTTLKRQKNKSCRQGKIGGSSDLKDPALPVIFDPDNDATKKTRSVSYDTRATRGAGMSSKSASCSKLLVSNTSAFNEKYSSLQKRKPMTRSASTSSMAALQSASASPSDKTTNKEKPQSRCSLSQLSLKSVALAVIATTRINNRAKRRGSVSSMSSASSAGGSTSNLAEDTTNTDDDSLRQNQHRCPSQSAFGEPPAFLRPPRTGQRQRMVRRNSSSNNVTMAVIQKLGALEGEDPMEEARVEYQQELQQILVSKRNHKFTAEALFPARHLVAVKQQQKRAAAANNNSSTSSLSIDDDDEDDFLDGLVFMAPNSEDSVRTMMGHLSRRYSMPRRKSTG